MKSLTQAVAASIALLLLEVAIPLAAQNHAALIATGTWNVSYNSPAEGPFEGFFDDRQVNRTINPGVEFLINPDGRFSVGTGFTQIKFEPETSTFVGVADRFQYIDSSGRTATIEMPGTIFFSNTVQTDPAEMNVFIGLAYVNLLTTGKVRPFVGLGGGIGFAKRNSTVQTFVHPLYAELVEGPDNRTDTSPSHHPAEKNLGIFAGKVGVNIYPKRHLLIRASGGYLNGGYGEVGVGVVF